VLGCGCGCVEGGCLGVGVCVCMERRC